MTDIDALAQELSAALGDSKQSSDVAAKLERFLEIDAPSLYALQSTIINVLSQWIKDRRDNPIGLSDLRDMAEIQILSTAATFMRANRRVGGGQFSVTEFTVTAAIVAGFVRDIDPLPPSQEVIN